MFALALTVAPLVGIGLRLRGCGGAADASRATSIVPLFGAVVGGILEGTPAEWIALPVAFASGWFGGDPARRASRRTKLAVGAAAAAALLVALVIGFGRFVERDPPYGVQAWSWLRAHVREARIAYTGTNLAFPLAGIRLGNEVRDVNVAGEPDDRLHDFARRLGTGPGGNPEPTLYRDGGSFDVW